MTDIIECKDLHWDFRDEPYLPLFSYHTQRVDPFPCYAHDPQIVRDTLEKVEGTATISLAPHSLFILHYETSTRTNGWASSESQWNGEKHVPSAGHITLNGKRIPPHPAVTRYLVSHEYGHHADYSICAHRGVENDGFDDEYAKLRGLTHDYSRYGGGYWHSNVGELIANDFRILVADVETDFWPHPGFDRPEDVPGLQQWWEENLT